MLIFSLCFSWKATYLPLSTGTSDEWAGCLYVWSVAAARQSHSKYAWGGGRIQHTMTSDAEPFQTDLLGPFRSPSSYGARLPGRVACLKWTCFFGRGFDIERMSAPWKKKSDWGGRLACWQKKTTAAESVILNKKERSGIWNSAMRLQKTLKRNVFPCLLWCSCDQTNQKQELWSVISESSERYLDGTELQKINVSRHCSSINNARLPSRSTWFLLQPLQLLKSTHHPQDEINWGVRWLFKEQKYTRLGVVVFAPLPLPPPSQVCLPVLPWNYSQDVLPLTL